MGNNVQIINEKMKLLVYEMSRLRNRSRQIINNNVLSSNRVGLVIEGGPGKQKTIATGNDIEDNFRNNKKNKRNKAIFK